MAQALAAGPLTLRFTTNEYVNPVGYNYIATRKAVDDRYGNTAPIVMVGARRRRARWRAPSASR